MAEELEEKQQPEKPEKKSKSLSLPLLIGIGAGGLVILLVAVFFIFSFLINDIVDKKLSNIDLAGSGENSELQSEEDHSPSKMTDEQYWRKMEEDEIMSADNDMGELYETGRIITNPRNSSDFAVMNLAIYYRLPPRDEDDEATKEENTEDGASYVPIEIKRLEPRLKSKIGTFIGTRTRAELDAIRPQLAEEIKEELTPMFKKNKIFLKNIEVTEYLIQMQ